MHDLPSLKRSMRFKGGMMVSIVPESGPPVTDFTGWTIAGSEVREKGGRLVATVACAWANAATGALAFDGGPMAGWPIGGLRHDVILVGPGGDPLATPTAEFEVEREVTPWAP
mgnify:CR=1 FL=1